MSKLERRVKREAKKVLARRLYRERKGGMPLPFFAVRKGPAGPSEKAAKRAGNQIHIPSKEEQKQLQKKML
jgi:hypothetical protein